MPLGMEVGLGPGDIVLDADPVRHPAPPKKKGAHPQFSAHIYWAKRLYASGYQLVRR